MLIVLPVYLYFIPVLKPVTDFDIFPSQLSLDQLAHDAT